MKKKNNKLVEIFDDLPEGLQNFICYTGMALLPAAVTGSIYGAVENNMDDEVFYGGILSSIIKVFAGIGIYLTVGTAELLLNVPHEVSLSSKFLSDYSCLYIICDVLLGSVFFVLGAEVTNKIKNIIINIKESIEEKKKAKELEEIKTKEDSKELIVDNSKTIAKSKTTRDKEELIALKEELLNINQTKEIDNPKKLFRK